MPSPPETRNMLSQSSPNQQQFWRPPAFNPARNGVHLERPTIGTVRRYSEDVDRGGLPNMPECQRKKGVAGYSDWLTLPRQDNFNICPGCYTAIFQDTAFRNQFVPMPFRPRDKEISCDFGSSAWYRIAWLLTLKTRQPDLRLLRQIATVTSSTASDPCPGRRRSTRLWYSIKNPRTQETIPDFCVCSACSKTVEALLPNLRGVFVPVDSTSVPKRAMCAMHFAGNERKRFVLYFDAMETTSDKALAAMDSPDLQSLAEEIERLSLYTECREDVVVKNGNWHVMQGIQDFTVCGECFDEVVRPKLDDENVVARRFYMNPQRVLVATCQLYSTRMREAFRKACRNDDPEYLAIKVSERRKKEDEIQAKIAKLDERGEQDAKTEEEVARLRQEWKRWE